MLARPSIADREAKDRPGALFLGFLVMMYGVIPWSDLGLNLPTLWWWFPEMSASFILFSILIGVVGGLGEEGLTGGFVDGARDLLGVALIVGVARGISVVMNNAQITDTVLHWTEDAVSGLGGGKFFILLSSSLSHSRS